MTEIKERQERLVTERTFIPFKCVDDTPGGSSLGRAEFEICPRFVRGNLKEYWVYPRQQRDVSEFFHYVGPVYKWAGFSISSYQELGPAVVWHQTWCKLHRTVTSRLYVPAGAKFIELDGYGVGFWREVP